MILCPTCGNKRCPRANDHTNACSGSNQPGQVGSAYPTPPAPVEAPLTSDDWREKVVTVGMLHALLTRLWQEVQTNAPLVDGDVDFLRNELERIAKGGAR